MIELMCEFAPLSYVAALYAIALAGALIALAWAEISLRLVIRACRSATAGTSP